MRKHGASIERLRRQAGALTTHLAGTRASPTIGYVDTTLTALPGGPHASLAHRCHTRDGSCYCCACTLRVRWWWRCVRDGRERFGIRSRAEHQFFCLERWGNARSRRCVVEHGDLQQRCLRPHVDGGHRAQLPVPDCLPERLVQRRGLQLLADSRPGNAVRRGVHLRRCRPHVRE